MGRKKNGKSKRGLGGRYVKVTDDAGKTLGVLVLTRRFWWRSEPPVDSPVHSRWVRDTQNGKNWEYKPAGIGIDSERKELLKYCSSEPDVTIVPGASRVGFDGKPTAYPENWDVTISEIWRKSSTVLGGEPTPELVQYRSLPKSQRTHFLAPRGMERSYIQLSDSFKIRERNLIPVLEKLLDNGIHIISLAGLRHALSQQ